MVIYSPDDIFTVRSLGSPCASSQRKTLLGLAGFECAQHQKKLRTQDACDHNRRHRKIGSGSAYGGAGVLVNVSDDRRSYWDGLPISGVRRYVWW